MLFFCIERRWVQHRNELPYSVPEQRYETVNRTFIATTADIKTSILRLYAKSVFRQARHISRSDHDVTGLGWEPHIDRWKLYAYERKKVL